jgi:hypothetical protein
MTRRGTIALLVALALLLAAGLTFNAHRRVLLRHQGVYPVDSRLALADGGDYVFLIARDERVVYRVSQNGWLLGPVAVWPHGAIKGVALDDRVKIEDERYGYAFGDGSVSVSVPGAGASSKTLEFSIDW